MCTSSLLGQHQKKIWKAAMMSIDTNGCADDTAEMPPADASAVRSSLLQGCMAAELDSASAASNARLLLAFAMRSSHPAQEFGSLVSTLLGAQAPAAAVPASAAGHAGSTDPAAAQEAQAAAVAPSSKSHASQLLLADALVSPHLPSCWAADMRTA